MVKRASPEWNEMALIQRSNHAAYVIPSRTTVLLASLAFGWRITAADPMATVVLIAFNATVIVFSLSRLVMILGDVGTAAD